MPSLIKRWSNAERPPIQLQPPPLQEDPKPPLHLRDNGNPPRPQVNSWLTGNDSEVSQVLANQGLNGGSAPTDRHTTNAVTGSRRVTGAEGKQLETPQNDLPTGSRNKSGIILRGSNLAARGWKGSKQDGIKVPSPVPGSWDAKVLNVAAKTADSVPPATMNSRINSTPNKREEIRERGRRPSAPRLRYNRTPIRFAVSGDWALKECEELTTWVNNILKGTDGDSLVEDLRKSIGDGVTLVALTEKIYLSVPDVEREITSRKDRINNITNCLEVLQSRGVDTAGIDAEDLADGSLKSALLLVGNIKNQFESAKGGNAGVPVPFITDDRSDMKNSSIVTSMPSAAPMSQMRGTPQTYGNEGSGHVTRKTYVTSMDDLLPGTAPMDKPAEPPNENLISMTEMSANGVAQYGVEERRATLTSQVLRMPRPHSAGRAKTPVGSANPPSVSAPAMSAWTENQTQSQAPLSVEDRLKSLINNGQNGTPPAQKHGFDQSKQTQPNCFEDGELLIPPPPKTSLSNDQGRYGSAMYRNNQMQIEQRSPNHNAYVPSVPEERYRGSRVEAILDRQTTGNHTAPQGYAGRPAPTLPGYRPSNGSNENPAYVDDTIRVTRGQDASQSGSELRNAWNKLYGGTPTPDRKTPIPSQNAPNSPTRKPQYQHLHQIKLPSVPVIGGRHTPSHPTTPPASGPPPQQSTFSYPSTSNTRTSPMGQSSSTIGQSSYSSQLSGNSPQTNEASNQNTSFHSFGTFSANHSQEEQSHSLPSSPGVTLGPSSKYPDYSVINKPVAAKNRPPSVPPKPENQFSRDMNSFKNQTLGDGFPFAGLSKSKTSLNSAHLGQEDRDIFGSTGFGLNKGDDQIDGPQGSIFDYISHSEPSSRSVTPPLPPLSNSPSESDLSTAHYSPKLPRSANNKFSTPKTPDLISNTRGDKRNKKPSAQSSYRMDKRNKYQQSISRMLNGHVKSGILSDVRESATDSDLPFDVEDTILTVDSQDTDNLPMHQGLASQDVNTVRDKLNNLESMYGEIMQALGIRGDHHDNARLQRRWSLGSSDTNSLRRPVGKKFRGANLGVLPGSQNRNHLSNRDIKAINRRFQRLESHVVTLARSVAHLSSELRTHTTVTQEMEGLRLELKEVKEQNSQGASKVAQNNDMSDYDRFRAWVPSITNPKRVNKLRKFFGQEPPLLQLFLKKLGYEKFTVNFESQQISMIELPYMTEDRLEKIGIPMGPRLRILQEAQQCFRQDNFSIYIV